MKKKIRNSKFGIRSYEMRGEECGVRSDTPARVQFRIPNSEFRTSRSGSTLTEVLVALMIASIGLVSVATLFPMSVLRSIKAAQTTSATDVRYNAESAIDRYPDIIKHPDSRNPLYTYPNANPPAGYNINYVDPPWLSMQLIGVKNYIVDPLGYNAVQALNLSIPNAGRPNGPSYYTRPEHFFGNDPSFPAGTLPWTADPPGTVFDTLPRYPLNCRTLADADFMVTLPDSWVLQYETIGPATTTGGAQLGPSTATASTYSQVTLPSLSFSSSLTGNAFPNLPSPTVRLVMFNGDGSLAQTRTATAFTSAGNSTTFQWTEDLNNNNTLDTTTGPPATTEDVNGNGVIDSHFLPASFVNTLALDASNNPIMGKVRVEMQERRYTWLLTVRQSSSSTASVDVVVYFKRTLENIAVDETLYETYFTQGSTQVQVKYPTGSNTVTGLPLKPYMKRGSFVFDANNAYWYRISNVSPVVASGTGWEQVNVTIETPANASNTTTPLAFPRGMFPRGVVDVFPIGTKSYQ